MTSQRRRDEKSLNPPDHQATEKSTLRAFVSAENQAETSLVIAKTNMMEKKIDDNRINERPRKALSAYNLFFKDERQIKDAERQGIGL